MTDGSVNRNMSPRSYQLGKRQARIDEGRRQVVDAAKALLAESTRYTAFTVDAVAKRADVARATVYYQFGSKTGLLEALCDALAEAGGMAELAQVFSDPDPVEALRSFVAAFGRFWAADRLVMRLLRSLGNLDPDVGTVVTARDGWRRKGLSVILGRIAQGSGRAAGAEVEEAVTVLHALTSFETFDALAGDDRQPTDVVGVVSDLAVAALAARGWRVDGA